MLWPRRLNAEDRAPSLAFWMRFNSHYKGDDCFCPVFLPPPTLLSIPLYYELFLQHVEHMQPQILQKTLP